MISFFVPGKPQPQGSKTVRPVRTRSGKVVGANIVEDNKELGGWRERVAITAHNAMTGRPLIDGAVSMNLAFVLPRPVSTPKTRTPFAIRKPDLDKLVRACFDAMTGVCFVADAQVVKVAAFKRLARIGETPGVGVELAALEGVVLQTVGSDDGLVDVSFRVKRELLTAIEDNMKDKGGDGGVPGELASLVGFGFYEDTGDDQFRP